MSLLAALTLADYDGVSGTSITYFYDKSIRVRWVGDWVAWQRAHW